MKRYFWAVFAAAGALALAASHVQAGSGLELRVTPRFTHAPGHALVTAVVDPHPENRALILEADCGGFYRSSEIQLAGEQSRRLHELRLRALPPGECQLTATLQGGEETSRARIRENLTILGVGRE